MRQNISDALDSVEDERNVLLIKRRNKTGAALINIDLLEDLLAAQNKDYLASIKKAREQAARGELFSHEDVFGDL